MAAFTAVPGISINAEQAIRMPADRPVWNAATAAAREKAAGITDKDAATLLGSGLVRQVRCDGGMSKEKAFEVMGKLLPLFFIKKMMALPRGDRTELHRKKELNMQVYGSKSFTDFLHTCVSTYISNDQQDRAVNGYFDVVRQPKGTI